MVNEINEGYTEFNSVGQRTGSFLAPIGRIGKFFTAFFASKAQKKADGS